MKQCPEAPALDEVEFSGHVWVQELPTGGEFRFQVAASGFVTFATPEQSFDTVAAVPPQFRRAAELINERLDRDALEAATDDPSSVTFCGTATRNEGVEYDWNSVPPFVGVDIWSGQKDQFLSPDAAASVFDRLGLPTLPAIEKELAAAHADFTRYGDESEFPQSAWRDDQAVGVLIRDKSGRRAVAWHQKQDQEPVSESQSATTLAAEYATTKQIERTIAALDGAEQSVTVDTIRDCLIADVARESYRDLFSNGEFVVSLSAFQSAVAERVQQHQSTAE
ncbi:hypothetical protein [Haloarcula sediminis]|uniref:hypothetical protein n=1 Tax=Haloarcula sediminis TaxID=3111777 RepID=UPI002D78C441|nr:hypothetical protein [Haloarcula sp. CK38]